MIIAAHITVYNGGRPSGPPWFPLSLWTASPASGINNPNPSSFGDVTRYSMRLGRADKSWQGTSFWLSYRLLTDAEYRYNCSFGSGLLLTRESES